MKDYPTFVQQKLQHVRHMKSSKVKKCESFQVENKQLSTHLKHSCVLMVICWFWMFPDWNRRFRGDWRFLFSSVRRLSHCGPTPTRWKTLVQKPLTAAGGGSSGFLPADKNSSQLNNKSSVFIFYCDNVVSSWATLSELFKLFLLWNNLFSLGRPRCFWQQKLLFDTTFNILIIHKWQTSLAETFITQY